MTVKRALVLCGDRWHPAATARAGLQPLESAGWTFDWNEDAAEWAPERIVDYPVVVLAKSNNRSASDHAPWMTSEVENAFVSYVRQGRGLLVIHSGSAGYDEAVGIRGVIGGCFKMHPPQCPVTVDPRAGHPLTAGSTPFTLVDEHYVMEQDDQGADVFMTTTSEHGVQPGGWTRREGEGRVCVLTPGHNLPVWHDPGYQALIHNALRWCAGLEGS